MPVGISFYTFQTLAYVIDVYRGQAKAEHHFGIYAAFISFFPQLVAGPIERTNNLLPQIKACHDFDYSQATYGVKLMAWGFFKKLCVADVLAVYSDKVFNDVYSYRGFALILAAVFFTFQIYCDFSGYSDIARGCAKLFGIELMENFRSPYFSASIREFWSRWHISLSTWFRDYVYIPLGGNRCGKFRRNVNLMITFIISGLWHGANWTFILWGAVHGFAQVIENALIRRDSEPHGIMRALRTLAVFGFCVLAWVLFRAQSVAEAGYVFAHMFDGVGRHIIYTRQGFHYIGMHKIFLPQLFIILMTLIWHDYISAFVNPNVIGTISHKSICTRWAAYILLGLAVIFLSPKGVATEFVYFQF